MEWLGEIWSWAWARHHNPLSWYIRPLFILPFCYFAYRKSGGWTWAKTAMTLLVQHHRARRDGGTDLQRCLLPAVASSGRPIDRVGLRGPRSSDSNRWTFTLDERAMGFFDKLFGTGGGDPAKRTVDDGQICAKCGQPVPRDNMAFDSGGGRPIHRKCPETPPGPTDSEG